MHTAVRCVFERPDKSSALRKLAPIKGLLVMNSQRFQSNRLIMVTPFTSRVIAIIDQIPYGMVSTYGVIAECAGNHRGAREVARILHTSSKKYNLPWHRVINRMGKISLRQFSGHEEQRHLLEQEGVHFDDNGRVDLELYLWWPH